MTGGDEVGSQVREVHTHVSAATLKAEFGLHAYPPRPGHVNAHRAASTNVWDLVCNQINRIARGLLP